jgi:hypothetical protein
MTRFKHFVIQGQSHEDIKTYVLNLTLYIVIESIAILNRYLAALN